MKNTLFILITILLIGCQSNPEYSDDLAGKREALEDKKSALKELENEIKLLESEVLLLDPPKEKSPILVNGLKMQKTTFERFVTIQGLVESDEIVNITAEMGGRIKSVNAKEGDYVKKGQLIAVIDMETLSKQIQEVETSLSLAENVYQRQKRLWEQNIGSEIQFLQAQNNKERLEKSLETLQSQLAKRNIYAPISGTIDHEFLSAGELAAPGVPIVNILDARKVTIVADIPENYLGKINRGDMVNLYFPSLNIELQKKVTQISRTIDPSNRTFQIEIETNNIDDVLKPNLLAEVRFMDFRKEDALIAPINYILEEVTGNKYVYIAKNQSGKTTVHKTYVTLGETYEGMAIIEKGLEAGDILITDGSRRVVENDPVIFEII
jgi:RND family efflux transporter MFP subunit